MDNARKKVSEEINKYTNQYKIFDYFLYARAAKIITKLVLKTSLTPNQITLISLFFGILAGFFFLLGDYFCIVIGVIFMQLVQIFDTVDGAVARFKNMSTSFGSFFDFSVNMITGYIAIATITLGIFFKNLDPTVLIFGLLAIGNFLMIHILRTAFRWKIASQEYNEYQVSKKLCLGGADTFTFSILIMGVLNQMYFFLLFLATIGGLVWIKKIFSYYVRSKSKK